MKANFKQQNRAKGLFEFKIDVRITKCKQTGKKQNPNMKNPVFQSALLMSYSLIFTFDVNGFTNWKFSRSKSLFSRHQENKLTELN